jgi:hypothetical protein
MLTVCGDDAGMEEERVPSLFSFLQLLGNHLPRVSGPKSPEKRRVSNLRFPDDDSSMPTILCKIAHFFYGLCLDKATASD